VLKEHGAKLDAASKSAVEASIEKVKTAEKGADVAAINSAVEALQQASYSLAQHVQNAAGAAPEAAAGGAKPDDGVIDAEFEKKS
jgi:molecular chaperone DnaK